MNLKPRKKLFQIVEGENNVNSKKTIFNSVIIIFILIDAILMIISIDKKRGDDWYDIVRAIDVVAVWVFAAEWLIRLWICVEYTKDKYRHPIKGRLNYIFSLKGIIDSLAFMPFIFGLITGIDCSIMRPFRLFKMLRYSAALSTLVDALRAEKKIFTSAALLMVILLIFVSSMMFHFEHEAQPESIGNIGDALWWGIVTLTTVGYGDIVPLTDAGRVLGGIATLLGFCMFAIPAGVLASTFAQESKKRDFVVTWNLVARMPILGQLNAAVIAEIASILKPKFATTGEYIIREGESGRCMFFVVDGTVEVRSGKYPVRLRSGSFFGEIELLGESKKRTADVIAITNTQLLSLEADDFKGILEENPEIEKALRIVAKRRMVSINNPNAAKDLEKTEKTVTIKKDLPS